MRNTFVSEITRLAEKNSKIVILAGDIGYKLFDKFIKKFPNRFYNCGVAEANMTTTAAGLAVKGFIPITYTIATFNVYKTIEQIKLDVCYPNLGVIIVGVGAGLSYADLGATHHATEDVGMLRTIPNLNIISPSDPLELKALLPKILINKKPTYLRLGKTGEKNIHIKEPKVELGKGNVIYKGKKVCIISSGNILKNTSLAIKVLKKKNVYPTLISLHTIKPLDIKLIQNCLKNHKYIIILEEHAEIGGLASAISEINLKKNYNNKFLCMNVGNKFIVKSGKQVFARERLSISEIKIKKKILNFLRILN